MASNTGSGEIDAEFFATWLKKMDEDVAVGFVLSGLALNKDRILDAFDTACQIMHMRSLKKAEELEKNNLEYLDITGNATDQDTKEFAKRIDDLIASVLESGKKKTETNE